MLAWAQRADVECKRLHQELRDRSDHLAGTLRIGALNSTTPFLGIFTLPFQQRFPEVNLRVMNHNAYEIQQGVEELGFDVTISYLDNKPGRYRRSRSLYAQEYYVLMRKGCIFSGRESVVWEELSKVPLCVFPEETSVLGSGISERLKESHPGIARLETNSMYVLLDHVRTGTCASILPKPVLFMIAGSDEFEAIPLPSSGEDGDIGIAVPHRDPESALAEAFFEIATSEDVLNRFYEFFQPSSLALPR